MDLGTLNTTGVTSRVSLSPCIAACIGGPFSGTGGQIHAHSHFTDTILRAGLSYQFH